MNFKNSMRFSIMHLYNKKSIFILSSIIMLVGIIVTYSIFNIYFISYKDILNTRNIFGSKRSHLYKINCGYNVPDYHYYEKYRDFLIELKEKYPVSVYETTDIAFEDNSNFALKERKNRIMDYAKRLNIDELLNKYPYQISGGQQQRAAIVRAMVSNNDVILADEPTGALDSNNSQELMKHMLMLKEMKKTIIMVTHDEKIANYSDRIIYLKDGQIIPEK